LINHCNFIKELNNMISQSNRKHLNKKRKNLGEQIADIKRMDDKMKRDVMLCLGMMSRRESNLKTSYYCYYFEDVNLKLNGQDSNISFQPTVNGYYFGVSVAQGPTLFPIQFVVADGPFDQVFILSSNINGIPMVKGENNMVSFLNAVNNARIAGDFVFTFSNTFSYGYNGSDNSNIKLRKFETNVLDSTQNSYIKYISNDGTNFTYEIKVGNGSQERFTCPQLKSFSVFLYEETTVDPLSNPQNNALTSIRINYPETYSNDLSVGTSLSMYYTPERWRECSPLDSTISNFTIPTNKVLVLPWGEGLTNPQCYFFGDISFNPATSTEVNSYITYVWSESKDLYGYASTVLSTSFPSLINSMMNEDGQTLDATHTGLPNELDNKNIIFYSRYTSAVNVQKAQWGTPTVWQDKTDSNFISAVRVVYNASLGTYTFTPLIGTIPTTTTVVDSTLNVLTLTSNDFTNSITPKTKLYMFALISRNDYVLNTFSDFYKYKLGFTSAAVDATGFTTFFTMPSPLNSTTTYSASTTSTITVGTAKAQICTFSIAIDTSHKNKNDLSDAYNFYASFLRTPSTGSANNYVSTGIQGSIFQPYGKVLQATLNVLTAPSIQESIVFFCNNHIENEIIVLFKGTTVSGFNLNVKRIRARYSSSMTSGSLSFRMGFYYDGANSKLVLFDPDTLEEWYWSPTIATGDIVQLALGSFAAPGYLAISSVSSLPSNIPKSYTNTFNLQSGVSNLSFVQHYLFMNCLHCSMYSLKGMTGYVSGQTNFNNLFVSFRRLNTLSDGYHYFLPKFVVSGTITNFNMLIISSSNNLNDLLPNNWFGISTTNNGSGFVQSMDNTNYSYTNTGIVLAKMRNVLTIKYNSTTSSYTVMYNGLAKTVQVSSISNIVFLRVGDELCFYDSGTQAILMIINAVNFGAKVGSTFSSLYSWMHLDYVGYNTSTSTVIKPSFRISDLGFSTDIANSPTIQHSSNLFRIDYDLQPQLRPTSNVFVKRGITNTFSENPNLIMSGLNAVRTNNTYYWGAASTTATDTEICGRWVFYVGFSGLTTQTNTDLYGFLNGIMFGVVISNSTSIYTGGNFPSANVMTGYSTLENIEVKSNSSMTSPVLLGSNNNFISKSDATTGAVFCAIGGVSSPPSQDTSLNLQATTGWTFISKVTGSAQIGANSSNLGHSHYNSNWSSINSIDCQNGNNSPTLSFSVGSVDCFMAINGTAAAAGVLSFIPEKGSQNNLCYNPSAAISGYTTAVNSKPFFYIPASNVLNGATGSEKFFMQWEFVGSSGQSQSGYTPVIGGTLTSTYGKAARQGVVYYPI
jgi:hypothetical protein